MQCERVLVKGAGELASATAHRLFRCGFRVVMTELERPTAVRRRVSFAAAIYSSEIEIEGVRGVAWRLDQAGALSRFDWTHIPVFIDPRGQLGRSWTADVIIDGRMLKRNLDNALGDAQLAIGLGPGLEAGRDVHWVVETNRGHDLGRVIASGRAAADTGLPGDIGGYTHERVLVAPVGGRFESRREIGDLVTAGDVIGAVAGQEIRAGTSGVIRGLIFAGLEVTAGQKLGDVDPRGEPSFCAAISDKARAISGGVLEIVVAHARRKSTTTP
jgi:xanthine dehydrogenase accessory factor